MHTFRATNSAVFAIILTSAWGCGTAGSGVEPSTDTLIADADSEVGLRDAAPIETGDAELHETAIEASADAAIDAPSDEASIDAPLPDGGLSFQFVATDEALFDVRKPNGAVTFGVVDPLAVDDEIANVSLNGGTATIGPGAGSEVDTRALLEFGEYRFRVRLATCAPTEELVNGLFSYANDGIDHDGDGLVDNPEIDIEILCGQPTFVNMTVWTEYTDDTHMKKQSRTVDLQTGTVFIGLDDAYGYDDSDPDNDKVDPTLAFPGFYDPSAFYEMGYAWSSTSVRYFIVINGTEVTLWTATDASRIPQEKTQMCFNLWHPDSHWNEEGAGAPAANEATLSLDWLRFTPLP